MKLIKGIIIAVGIIISTAFYMHSKDGTELLAQSEGVVMLENRDADVDVDVGQNDSSREQVTAEIGERDKEMLAELVRTAVREELTAICEEGYLERALEEGAALAAAEADARKGMVNINSDDVKELMKLDGIGEKRAHDIINYRMENGDFQTPRDIMKVNGIKESLYEKIKDKIYTL